MRPSTSFLRAFARPSAPRAGRAFRAEHIPAPARRPFHTPRTSAATRPSPGLSPTHLPATARFESSAASPTSTNAPESRLDRDQVPSYELTFTCNVCKTRSSHRLSKQGYHHGTVLISCPDCKNRHLISDHLKVRLNLGQNKHLATANPGQIFSDKSVTIEDLMREKGNLVKKGSLSAEGDVEFWDDGSSTPRSAHFHPDSKPKGDDRFTEQPAPSRPSQD
ncbi:Nn.00g110540.m01.CDS01 [Neocucurbitaria sp. VM-36]